ncbi:MAG TPA: hypothetical protein VK249_15915 [Anaerolineales bacterium]|nr:hypothetical protein [Anaerolineales bacterium]
MAKVRNNVVIRGLSGSFGEQMVIRIDKAGRTIVVNKPEYDENRVFTPSQLAQQEKFREAVAYAKDAKTEDIYVAKAEGTPLQPYNVALADWLHAPEIKEIDLAAWTGGIGQPIRIRAMDDVQVTQVTVVITDESDAVLEQGAAVAGDGSWWTYMTTTSISATTPKVLVSVKDLPGHITQMTKNLN